MTLRELGELRETDPLNYYFLEYALSERNRRENEALESARDGR